MRTDYDLIAHEYDDQPYRQKGVDEHLLEFASAHPPSGRLAVLDLGCGTGNQLVANRDAFPDALMVGLDLFAGMLGQAQKKGGKIHWVRCDGATPPFADRSFHFISNQFSFHHVDDKAEMLRQVHRILKPGGRFVMTNVCPREMEDFLVYRYFPGAREQDLQDFLPFRDIVHLMEVVGFRNIDVELRRWRHDQDLRDFAAWTKQRHACSQLIAISDEDYAAGRDRLAREIAAAGDNPIPVVEESCLAVISGNRP